MQDNNERDRTAEGMPLAAAEVFAPDLRWSRHIQSAIPECSAVRDEILLRCNDAGSQVDEGQLLNAVVAEVWKLLRQLTIDRHDVTWVDLDHLRRRSDFDHTVLAAYLSTRGAVGLALNDKLSFHLNHVVPDRLAVLVESGVFGDRE